MGRSFSVGGHLVSDYVNLHKACVKETNETATLLYQHWNSNLTRLNAELGKHCQREGAIHSCIAAERPWTKIYRARYQLPKSCDFLSIPLHNHGITQTAAAKLPPKKSSVRSCIRCSWYFNSYLKQRTS